MDDSYVHLGLKAMDDILSQSPERTLEAKSRGCAVSLRPQVLTSGNWNAGFGEGPRSQGDGVVQSKHSSSST